MLTIWGRLNSHNTKKVVWAAVEAGIDWERRDMGGAFGYTPDYLAHNPNRLVPAIQQGDFWLWESNAILRYIADAHAPHLWAGTPAQRAQADKWLDWQFTFADAQREGFLQMVRVAAPDRDMAKIARTTQETAKLMAIMDAALADQPYLSGADFGIGDIGMATYTNTWLKLGFDRDGDGAPLAVPHVRDWFARVSQRPGFAAIDIPLT
ncbi:glutathione S-transferase [Novosphingobium sp. FSY-8]|uniref:Glutathione S-transferase n=1 Tax=Novosphingobium ovatum TaxID=1908523 RepID=A0ABW9XA59_9SPHN|nr:glutathione S-transferase family protein [Novosphingobium ovatum]NBC35385.1 glutathione S-transferase [Novosphingobium ovatum]